MSTNVSGSTPVVVPLSVGSTYLNGHASRSSNDDALQRSEDGGFASVTIPVPEVLQYLISVVWSIRVKLALPRQHHLIHIFAIVCAEGASLKYAGWSNKDTLSTVFLTLLLGWFVCPVRSNLKRMNERLDDMFLKIGALQNSTESLECPCVIRPPAEGFLASAKPTTDTFFPKEAAPQIKPSRSIGPPFLKGSKKNKDSPTSASTEPQTPGDPPLATVTDSIPYPPYVIHATPEPDTTSTVIESSLPSLSPAVLGHDSRSGVTLEGMDNITEESKVSPAEVIKSPSPAPPAPRDGGVVLEGWENIVDLPNVGTAQAATPLIKPPPLPSPPALSRPGHEGGVEGTDNIDGVFRWLAVVREIKQRLEQFAEGRFERVSDLNQSKSPNTLSFCRCAVRLLMCAASLSPANFVSAVGYLGPNESTPYYPTGDLQRDRTFAFTNAMDCLDDLEVYLRGDSDVQIATKLFELAQALSDLGLHEYALNTSGFALDAFERPYVMAPDDFRLRVSSILSLRANILCDLKRNDEAINASDRALVLCKEHQGSQTAPGLEWANASLNHAVLLSSIGLKDESAAVAFELLGEVDESRPDMKIISALCKLCLSNMRIGADDGMDLSSAEETIEITRSSSDAISQTVLAGALLNKSKILSSKGQNDPAISVSAEAVTLLRSMSSTRTVFSLFLAHALDTHAIHLSRANRKGESYSIRRDAVELWQLLKVSAPRAVVRPLAWSLFELAKFRHSGHDRNVLREEVRIAEEAVEMFRNVVPLDTPGLGDALYLYADRMLELDKNREAVTYAEESVLYFREASSEDPKYALDLIFSLTLASSCLACTERADFAFEYAKQAVEVQHGRKAAGGTEEQYNAHLRKLLMDVVYRATEMDREDEAAPWYHELRALHGSDDPGVPLARRSGNSRGNNDEFRKQTSYWMDENNDTPGSNPGSPSPAPVGSSSAIHLDKGKGKEVAPSPTAGNSTPRVDKGKGKEINTQFDPSSPRLRLADEEIFSPGAAAAAAAQRRLAGFGNSSPPPGIFRGRGLGRNDLMSGLLGTGSGRTLGSTSSSIGSVGSSPPSGSPRVGDRTLGGVGGVVGSPSSDDRLSGGSDSFGGFGGFGTSINGAIGRMSANLGRLGQDGQDPQSSSTPRTGT